MQPLCTEEEKPCTRDWKREGHVQLGFLLCQFAKFVSLQLQSVICERKVIHCCERFFFQFENFSPCDLTDVEAMDSLFHQSMTWVTENDITGALDLSFTVSEEIFGQVRLSTRTF